MTRPGDGNPKTLSTVLVGILSVVILVLLIMLLELGYYRLAKGEAEAKQDQGAVADLANLQAEQEAQLQVTGWLDEERTQLAIPIELAMERIVAEQREGERD